eukprot:CAMPEP_0172668370 /NCGR_PEP_ID=MMETSP1074-20121228/9018_1 /TAXON_ID=2916 /ORGANISM="Ceratium fusus, Strain PA161109" /LENGTH=376 /DNA_ID=CAMNT_0013485011 /DNA_START=89 /DNA_END=1219 /DNA_ORIENTATION=+
MTVPALLFQGLLAGMLHVPVRAASFAGTQHGTYASGSLLPQDVGSRSKVLAGLHKELSALIEVATRHSSASMRREQRVNAGSVGVNVEADGVVSVAGKRDAQQSADSGGNTDVVKPTIVPAKADPDPLEQQAASEVKATIVSAKADPDPLEQQAASEEEGKSTTPAFNVANKPPQQQQQSLPQQGQGSLLGAAEFRALTGPPGSPGPKGQDAMETDAALWVGPPGPPGKVGPPGDRGPDGPQGHEGARGKRGRQGTFTDDQVARFNKAVADIQRALELAMYQDTVEQTTLNKRMERLKRHLAELEQNMTMAEQLAHSTKNDVQTLVQDAEKEEAKTSNVSKAIDKEEKKEQEVLAKEAKMKDEILAHTITTQEKIG